MSDSCIFCKIAAGIIPAQIIFQDDEVIAFHDLNPQAPYHVLVIPKAHYATLNDIPTSNTHIVGKLITTAAALSKEHGLAEKGYRVVMNCNSDGGQSVYHIHLHMLGGRQMTWPPG